jgi:hypothetical protein
MTTFIHINPAEPAPYEVRDARGVLCRCYSMAAARKEQAKFTPRPTRAHVEDGSLDSIAAEMRRRSEQG